MLVTAVSPTPAGEGKTTTTVGLGDALTRIGERAMICLREPALGPVFGMKGGAAGGGYAQVVPMEDINLHFTGDFSAIAVATNLLAAMIDNHIHHGNALGIDVRRVTWRRVLDVSDRALRDVVIGLGGPGNGYPRESGFDIVVASEVMAIFCLAADLHDLKERLGDIVVGYTRDRQPVRARDLGAHGAMTAVLRDALAPNLVQTLENTPAFVHGGPFANIAHGCNSYLRHEFCPAPRGLRRDRGRIRRRPRRREVRRHPVPDDRACALGRGDRRDGARDEVPRRRRGRRTAERERRRPRARDRSTSSATSRPSARRSGLPAVVAINHRAEDTDAEVAALVAAVERAGAVAVVATHFAEGGAGAEELAREVVRLCAEPSELRFTYPDEASLWEKMRAIATRIYGASEITASTAVRAQIHRLQSEGYGAYPVCVAKTQYSFSTDPEAARRPIGPRRSTSARCASRRAPASS